ncbi:MAG: GumC family protein [Sandaracinaceae bacterium]
MATHDEPLERSPAPDPAGGLDLHAVLRMLWSYAPLILLATVLVGAGVTLWTLQQPKVYRASCTIEYDPTPTSPLGSEVEDVATPLGNFWMSQEFFATQNRVIASRMLAERVVRDLGLHEDPSFFYVPEERQGEWEGRSVEAAARALQSRISVEPVVDTRIVQISVTDRDPERAATLANSVAEAYIEKTLEDRLGSTISARDWLGTQLDNLREELEASEYSLHEFKAEHHILSVSLEDRQNVLAAEISNLNQGLTEARTRRIELAARLERLRALVEEESLEASAAALADHDAIRALHTRLQERRSAQEGLRPRYGPNHPQMVQLASEIEDVERQLRLEITAMLRAAEADVREAQQIEGSLREELARANRAGLDLNLREIEYQRLNRERENNSKLYSLLLERTTETDLTRLLRTTHARLLDRALAPTGPESPSLLRNAAAGLGVGLALGLALTLLLDRLDRRIRTVTDVEAMGLTILGILPRIEEDDAPPAAASNGRDRRRRRRREQDAEPGERDMFVHTHPMSAAAECCRTIRTNLTFLSADEPIRTLVVTSGSPKEGKTTIAINLAVSLAKSGKSVLVVDTDLRRPRIHRAFGVSGQRGVTSVVVGEADLEEAVVRTKIPELSVLPCGPIPPNPSELLHSQRFAELIERAQERYDRVIFDSPPLRAVTDAAVLAPQLDAALIVVKALYTTRDTLRSTLRQLRDVGAYVVGGVLNDVDSRRGGYGAGEQYYYYHRREGYYRTDDEGDDDEAYERDEGPTSAAPPPS